jgi:hypothetical protein
MTVWFTAAVSLAPCAKSTASSSTVDSIWLVVYISPLYSLVSCTSGLAKLEINFSIFLFGNYQVGKRVCRDQVAPWLHRLR